MALKNPLLKKSRFPNFSEITPERVKSAIPYLIERNQKILKKTLTQKSHSWENTLTPIEEMEDHLNQTWSPIAHLNSVKNSPELHAAYSECLGLISDYHTQVGQDAAFYAAIKQIRESKDFSSLSQAQKKTIEDHLRDFRLQGAELDPEKKEIFRKLKQELVQACDRFEQNVLESTQNFLHKITQETRLTGLPGYVLELAKNKAKKSGETGWHFGLDFPTYHAVMTYADDADFRKVMYHAYQTRASELGNAKWDNTPLLHQILKLRHELATLLGFSNYAEYALSTRMAKSTEHVLSFLQDLIDKTKPFADKEIAELKKFAKKNFGVTNLEAWDIAYFSEKLQQKKFKLSQEKLRPYFPEARVLRGLFKIIEKLFGMSVKPKRCKDVWDESVRLYEIRDFEKKVRGYFYLDLYARPNKRGGAWMDECVNRRITATQKLQLPIAFVTCNFTPPNNDQIALLTHEEVITLFHEMGHALQHLLTQIDCSYVSGINGVPWDAVELPSQFLEHWCWHPESLKLISSHYETHRALPKKITRKLIASKNFQSALQMLRQLEFALFDFRLHTEFSLNSPENFTQLILNEVRKKTSVIPVPHFNRFQNTFTHVFCGGYAAGYYSYKWAEVLSSDAFSKFEENGIFDEATGTLFLNTFLEQGGAEDPTQLFIQFRGREPEIHALLRHSGIGMEQNP